MSAPDVAALVRGWEPAQHDPDDDSRLNARLAELGAARPRHASNGRLMLTAGMIGLSMALAGSVRSETDRPVQVHDGSYEPTDEDRACYSAWLAELEASRSDWPRLAGPDDHRAFQESVRQFYAADSGR